VVPGDELTGRELAGHDVDEHAAAGSAADPDSTDRAGPGGAEPAGPLPGRSITSLLAGLPRRWLAIFAVALGAFLVRFLIPSPVAQADNRDGPRLLCGLGLTPVTHGGPRYFRYAYFEYVTSPACAGRAPYPSSQLVPLELARLLTPVFGLRGSLNMIALGVLMCALASVGIASLATGLRIRLRAQLLVAAVVWVIVADAAFFDVFAGPFSEPAALVGLLLVAAGVVYLGRSWRLTVLGLVLAGSGGFLAILSKEQYLILAAPICLTLVLASAGPGAWHGLRKLRTREAQAALVVAMLLAVLAGTYVGWNFTSSYGKRLQHIQAVDMIFTDIVTKRATAPAELRTLGLPVSWARYAGHYYWDSGSVRTNPLLGRYEGRLTDATIAHYLLTHPGLVISIGQKAATQAQLVQQSALGNYPPSAGHPPGTIEARVVVFTWLMHRLPRHLTLLGYVLLWVTMAAIAVVALRWPRRRPWNRDGAVLVLCMTGCAGTAFIPPAYFAGISITRHMVGMNLATALALAIAIGLAASMIRQAVAKPWRPRPAGAAPAVPELTRRNA
jgi:hypothetical protein